MVTGGKSTKRVVTHDPATGTEFPTYVSFVPPCKGKRRVPKYRLKVPDSHCREQGIGSKSFVFNSLAELLASAAYKKVVADDERYFREGRVAPRRKRTDAHKQWSVCEYKRMVREGVEIHPDITFRHRGATWALSRTFGTGWTFRATAHAYADAVALHRECANVRSVEEVIGDETTEANKHKKIPFSRAILARVRLRAEGPREGEEAEEEEEEEARRSKWKPSRWCRKARRARSDEEEEEDEEEDEDDVEGVTIRSSRSGRACKRPNLYSQGGGAAATGPAARRQDHRGGGGPARAGRVGAEGDGIDGGGWPLEPGRLGRRADPSLRRRGRDAVAQGDPRAHCAPLVRRTMVVRMVAVVLVWDLKQTRAHTPRTHAHTPTCTHVGEFTCTPRRQSTAGSRCRP